jgi:hypothetical protein
MNIKVIALAAAMAAPAGSVAASVLFHDDFESYTLGAPSTLAPTWTVTDGSIDVIGNGFFDFYPGNGKYIDLNGSIGPSTAGRIETSIGGFNIGSMYTLTFTYGANGNSTPPNAETLLFGIDTLLDSILIPGDVAAPLTTVSYTFQATASALTLFFADGQFGAPFDDDDDQGGPVLLEVKVAAVPLPAAGLMLIGALGGMALLRRRRA